MYINNSFGNRPSNEPYICGMSSKCSNCNMKLICEKSPFCVLSNITNLDKCKYDEKEISEIYHTTLNSLQINKELINSVSNIFSLIQKIEEELKGIKNKVDLIDKNQKKYSYDYEKYEEGNVLDNMVSNSESLSVIGEGSETEVLVQRKGIFGKTKWVSEKAK